MDALSCSSRQKAPRRLKVKSGCKTCKLRKVKCDEEKPSCRRCVSTGRVCEGYGVWGGGGNSYAEGYQSQRIVVCEYPTTAPVARICPRAVSVSCLSVSEQDQCDWFWRRTARKLPGAFYTEDGNALMLQASLSEPAILHAVLALGAAHRAIAAEPYHFADSAERADCFTLRQYNKAITFLQPHLSARSLSSLRVTLITCIGFIFLDFLRGYYRSGLAHLAHALSLAEQLLNTPSSLKSYDGRSLNGSYVDRWLLESIIRLCVQAALFGQTVPPEWLVNYATDIPDCPSSFSSIHEARQHLESLLMQTFHINKHKLDSTQDYKASRPYVEDHKALLRLQLGLCAWHDALEATLEPRSREKISIYVFAYKLLRVYHVMATIMVARRVRNLPELGNDHQVSQFRSILDQVKELFRVVFATNFRQKYLKDHDTSGNAVSDIGAIPPLFYVAMNCSVRSIRMEAIDLLRALPHKEGMWDATLAARIAGKVMDIEDELHHEKGSMVTEEDITRLYGQQSVKSPSTQLQKVQVVLPREPSGSVTLRCTFKYDHCHRGTAVAEYEIPAT